MFFESLWPRYWNKINIIIRNIQQHKLLMTSEVTLANITEASQARTRSYEENDKSEIQRDRQNFEAARTYISPNMYAQELYKITQKCTTATGQWLLKEEAFSKWTDEQDLSIRTIWLVGIPGAGKLVSNASTTYFT